MHSCNARVFNMSFACVHPIVIFTYDIVGPRPALVQKNIAWFLVFFNFFSFLIAPDK